MKTEDIEKAELEALYAEKREKLTARLPVWSLLITLFGAFSYAGIQSGIAGYIVLFYPLLAGCVALYAGHSEKVLDRVKRRIHAIEVKNNYQGYESDNAGSKRRGSGAHMQALRSFVMLTDAMAIIALSARFIMDAMPEEAATLAQFIKHSMPTPAVLALFCLIAAVLATWRWLCDEPTYQRATQPPLQNNDVLQNAPKEEATK